MTSAEPRRLRADAARNRQALMDAAERLFATRGLAVTLDDIAAEAGVNVATAYRHFANKHELARAFLQQSIDRAVAVAERSLTYADPWEGLTAFLEGTLDLMGDNHGLMDVFTSAYGTDWFEQLQHRIKPLVAELLARGQRSGAVRADVRPEDFGLLVPMLGSVSGPDVDTACRLRRRCLSLVLAGLRSGEPSLAGDPPTDDEIRPIGRSRGHRRA
jgi:AcrR family transcriptional regulator